MANPMKDYLTADQLILLYFFNRKNKPATVDEIKETLEAPRSTVVEHMESLRIDGFLKVRKEAKFKYYEVDPDIMAEMGKSLTVLQGAYVHALGLIRQKQLEDIKKFGRGSNGTK